MDKSKRNMYQFIYGFILMCIYSRYMAVWFELQYNKEKNKLISENNFDETFSLKGNY